MSTIITIPTELETRIAARAAAKGVSVEEYACEILARDIDAPSLRELFAPVREQIRSEGTSSEELAAQIETAVSEVRERRRG